MSPLLPDFNRSFRGAIKQRVPLPVRPPPPPAPVTAAGHRRLGVELGGTALATLSPDERRGHTHIMGGSGRGKSYLLQHLIRRDIEDPDCGLCLLDPHDNLYRPLVRYIAEVRPELAERVVLFDVTGNSGPLPGFNPIGPDAREFPEYTLNMLVMSCLRAWQQDRSDRTPRIRRQLENIFAPIIANGLTLMETVPLISTSRHSAKRALLLAALDHELIRAEWEEFEAASPTVRQQLLEGAGNRLRKFLGNSVLRHVLGQQEHVLDIDRIIAEKKILLVNLQPTRAIDRENTNLLGILLINEFFRAALLRDPDSNPHPFFLHIDEFAQFISPTAAEILDECRKYGLFLTLAHQRLGQLDREDEWLRDAVIALCNNRYVFGGLHVDEAEFLARQMYIGFDDLTQVKHTDWQTKFRPVEERRCVPSRSRSASRSRTEAFTESFGESTARSRSLADAISEGHAQARGRTTSRGTQLTRGTSHSAGTQQGGQQSRTASRQHGVTDSRSWSESESEQETTGRSDGENHQTARQTGRQETDSSGRTLDPDGHLRQRQAGSSAATTATESAAVGTSTVLQSTAAHGRSRQAGGSAGETVTTGAATTAGTSWGRNATQGKTYQQAVSNSAATTVTETDSQTRTRTQTDGITKSESRQRGHSEAHAETAGESESESLVPFHRMEEYQEARLTFKSPQEIMLQRAGQLKEQPVGVATVKIGATAPRQIRIDTLPPLPAAGAARTHAAAALLERVARASPEFYATPEAVRQEIDGRQERIFGEVLRLEYRAAPLGLPAPAAAQPAPAAAPAPSVRPVGWHFSDDDEAA